MELIRRYLFLLRLKNNTLSNTSAAIDRFSQLPNVPLSIAPYPPAHATIPTFIRLKPIKRTTIPETSGVMMSRRYLNVRLTTISTGAAAIQAPNIKGKPPTRSEERRVGKECRSRWSPYHYKKKQGNPSQTAPSNERNTSHHYNYT